MFVVASPYFLYQAIRHQKYIGSLRQRLGLPAGLVQRRRRRVDLDPRRVGRRGADRARAGGRSARRATRGCASFSRRRRWRGSRWRGAACRRRRASSTSRSTGRSSSGARSTLVKPRALHHDGDRDLAEPAARVPRRAASRRWSINGRISSRSYPRYRLVRPFFRRVLADVDRFCMQSEESARRLIDLGADPARVTVTGSLKFDSLERARRRGARQAARSRAALLPHRRRTAPSSSPAARCAARRRRCCARSRASRRPAPGALLRHRAAAAGAVRRGGAPRARGGASRPCGAPSCRSTPSRAPTSWCSTRSASWRSSIRSRPRCSSAAASSITGGHNILEPAMFGKPIVFGPHMQNFERDRRGVPRATARRCRCSRERELDEALLTLVTDPVRRARSAPRRARWSKPTAARRTRRSPSSRDAAAARRRRPGRRPCVRPFRRGALIRRRSSRAVYGAVSARLARGAWYARRSRAPAAPVAARDQRRQPRASAAAARRPSSRTSRGCSSRAGERPAILTRGYGRRRSAPRRDRGVATARRSRADLDAAGDEPLMLARAAAGRARSSSAPTAISPAGLAERRLGATVHVLDDGFQHLSWRATSICCVVVGRRPGGSPAAGRAAARAAGGGRGRRRRARDRGLRRAPSERIARARSASPTAFRVTRALGAPRTVAGARDSVVVPPDVARVRAWPASRVPSASSPTSTRRAGDVVGTMAFRDHHRVRGSATSRASRRRRSAAARGDRADDREGRRAARGAAIWQSCRSPSVPLIAAASSRRDRFRELAAGAAGAPRCDEAPRSNTLAVAVAARAWRALDARPARARDGHAARPGRSTRSIARTAGSRERNLAAAFPARSDARAAHDRARRASRISGGCSFELLKFGTLSPEAMLARVEFEGEERVRAAPTRRARACCSVTGHFGYWELQALVHALRLEPIGVLGARARQPALERAARATSASAPATR